VICRRKALLEPVLSDLAAVFLTDRGGRGINYGPGSAGPAIPIGRDIPARRREKVRLIKMLGLAAVAAMAAMAFVASSASADAENIVLCKNAELVCLNPFPNPTTIKAKATNPKLLSSGGTVECEKSDTEVTLLNTLSKLIEGHILKLSFEGKCERNKVESCTVTVGETGGLSFTKIGPLEASAKGITLYLGPNKTEPMLTKATVKCGSFINCTYNDANEPLLKVTSLANGVTHVKAEKAVLSNSGGFLCPTTSEWDAEYVAEGTMYVES
jgi:hypothetical protein